MQKVLEDADLTEKEIDEIAGAIAQRSMSDNGLILPPRVMSLHTISMPCVTTNKLKDEDRNYLDMETMMPWMMLSMGTREPP